MNTSAVPKILVIDDEALTHALFARYLQVLGFDAVFAYDGMEGLEVVAAQMPDLVITDLYMERMDGFAVLERMGQTHPDTPVVALSGADDMDAVIQALRLGAWDYLRKPIKKKAFLYNTLTRALERSRLIKENRRYHTDLQKMVAAKTAEIRSGELRFRTMADFAYDWECWLSPRGELIYCSPSCERMTGYPVSAFKARPKLMIDIVHEKDRATVASHYQETGSMQESCHLNFRIVTRGGETRWISHNCRAVYDGDDRYLGRRMSNRDITRQKRYENDLEKQQVELAEKSRHLERVNHALKALLDHREVERQSIEASLLANLKRHVFPYLDQLAGMSLDLQAQSFLQIIRNNIEELVTPMNPYLSTAYQSLTPVEASVADLIRLGKGTKEIAHLKHISPSTVAIHRNKIRKKLGLVNSKTNLQTYLQSLK
ncbi:MAG: response regulator [Desulfosarcinaceae bacterium]